MRSAECVLFGKRYMWVSVMGRLELRPAINWSAPSRELGQGPSYGELMEVLARVERDGQGDAPH